jgi:hypothetical protein
MLVEPGLLGVVVTLRLSYRDSQKLTAVKVEMLVPVKIAILQIAVYAARVNRAFPDKLPSGYRC